jgi:hypothetical protein
MAKAKKHQAYTISEKDMEEFLNMLTEEQRDHLKATVKEVDDKTLAGPSKSTDVIVSNFSKNGVIGW